MQIPAITSSMPRSGIREIMDLALRRPGTIRLELGEPDFPTPPNIVEAASRASAAGLTRYTPTAGVPALREALAEKIRLRNGFEVEAARVLVSSGAVQGIYVALAGLIDPGQGILVPSPGWPNYLMMCRLLRAQPVGYRLREEHGYLPTVAELEEAVTPQTRAIVLNAPSNPLGSVFDAARLAEVVTWANARDLWIVSDECYDELTFDRPHVSAAVFDQRDAVISVFSFSKTYAMTGWRIGYLALPQAAVTTLSNSHEAMMSCVAMPTQYAALEAVTGPQDAVALMRSAYHRRRDAALTDLAARGIPAYRPDGAFYVWLDVSASGLRSDEFARRLVAEAGVAVAPGTAFGPGGEGHVRLSIANGDDSIREGVGRIADALAADAVPVR
jgi:aspartate/methionine/tyrosine aminotransferase